jgi:glycosyltransferase involved in cell wall biosynthesis
MATVIVSTHNVVNFPDGGGHFWVYMQYIEGLRRAGCDVYWLEQFRPHGRAEYDTWLVRSFVERMKHRGMDDRTVLYSFAEGTDGGEALEPAFINLGSQQAEDILKRADLLLNFNYRMRPGFLARFRRTALVDIDPGLLQFWISTGQVRAAPHDYYLTIGETVGTERALFPSCDLNWIHIRPPVCLELWPYVHDPDCEAFTTVAGWWSGEWIKEIIDGRAEVYENTKRVSFLEFAGLPRLTNQPLELALLLANDDGDERRLLENHGWRVRQTQDVAGTPEMYQAYIQRSRGEFSCAKPSCMKLQNGWVSDRTLCYMASGKPVVVQNTGPSAILPNGLGMFRFSTMEEAADALRAVNADYARHCRAAREFTEAYFDAKTIAGRILDATLT